MSMFDIRFLNRLSWRSLLLTLLQLNAVTLRACWGELISLILAQVQYWVRSVQQPCLVKEDFNLFVFSSDSLRKIRDWCTVTFVRWTEKEKVWEGEVRTQQRLPGLFTWKLKTDTASLSPLLISIQQESPPVPRGCQFLGELTWFFPFFQVFDFELSPEDMKAIDGLNRNRRYYEFLP